MKLLLNKNNSIYVTKYPRNFCLFGSTKLCVFLAVKFHVIRIHLFVLQKLNSLHGEIKNTFNDIYVMCIEMFYTT